MQLTMLASAYSRLPVTTNHASCHLTASVRSPSPPRTWEVTFPLSWISTFASRNVCVVAKPSVQRRPPNMPVISSALRWGLEPLSRYHAAALRTELPAASRGIAVETAHQCAWGSAAWWMLALSMPPRTLAIFRTEVSCAPCMMDQRMLMWATSVPRDGAVLPRSACPIMAVGSVAWRWAAARRSACRPWVASEADWIFGQRSTSMHLPRRASGVKGDLHTIATANYARRTWTTLHGVRGGVDEKHHRVVSDVETKEPATPRKRRPAPLPSPPSPRSRGRRARHPQN
jgi:hypothetical protein